jgi:hypothetical protein
METKQLLAAAKLIRRLRSVVSTGNWEWVGGVLSDAREMRGGLPECCLRELQVSNVVTSCGWRGLRLHLCTFGVAWTVWTASAR